MTNYTDADAYLRYHSNIVMYQVTDIFVTNEPTATRFDSSHGKTNDGIHVATSCFVEFLQIATLPIQLMQNENRPN